MFRLLMVLPPFMTPADPIATKAEVIGPVQQRTNGRDSLLPMDDLAAEMDALRARIRAQSKSVAEHIAMDSDAKAFIDDWAIPDPVSR
jgi:hypothetical protein